MKDSEIRQEALRRSWDLELLRKEGMEVENASHGGAEISGENGDIFKLGPYSCRNLQYRQKLNDQQHKSRKKSTKVIPALEEIYNPYGNPEIQISDNGLPFNSKAMENFTQSKYIEMKKIPLLHP